MNARILGFEIEVHRTEEVVRISHRHGLHPKTLHALQERLYGNRPFEKAILGVNVQVDEVLRLHAERLNNNLSPN